MSNGWRNWVVAFQVCTEEPHRCSRSAKLPPLFLPAMQRCNEPIECSRSHKIIYGVPIRPKQKEMEVIWFDNLTWPWTGHDCPSHDTMLPGIADLSAQYLREQCIELNLPKPYQLVIIVCVKKVEPGPLHVVALKSVIGDIFCINLRGAVTPRWGDLAALCGSDVDQRLLTVSNQILTADGPADPGLLDIRTTESRTKECKRCRRAMDE
jgi:hypothetical protein